MRQYKTTAIVLKARDLSEKDRIITFYSPTLGRFNAVVRGARKINAKSMGKMEPMNLVLLESAKGRNLDTIAQSEFICSFPVIRSDLKRTAGALYMLDMVCRNSEEREENRNLYILLKNCLFMLEKKASPLIVNRIFEVKFVSIMGYQPVLEECVNCNKSGTWEFFDFEQGGLICSSCLSDGTQRAGCRVTSGALDVMKLLQKTSFRALVRFSAPVPALEEIQLIMNRYIGYVLPGGSVPLKNYEALSE